MKRGSLRPVLALLFAAAASIVVSPHVDAARTAGPLELPRLLRAYGNGSEAAGLAMIAALRESASATVTNTSPQTVVA